MCLCIVSSVLFFVFKQKTAYELRISDWSSDVCSSDLKLFRFVDSHDVRAAVLPILLAYSCAQFPRRRQVPLTDCRHRYDPPPEPNVSGCSRSTWRHLVSTRADPDVSSSGNFGLLVRSRPWSAPQHFQGPFRFPANQYSVLSSEVWWPIGIEPCRER